MSDGDIHWHISMPGSSVTCVTNNLTYAHFNLLTKHAFPNIARYRSIIDVTHFNTQVPQAMGSLSVCGNGTVLHQLGSSLVRISVGSVRACINIEDIVHAEPDCCSCQLGTQHTSHVPLLKARCLACLLRTISVFHP